MADHAWLLLLAFVLFPLRRGRVGRRSAFVPRDGLSPFPLSGSPRAAQRSFGWRGRARRNGLCADMRDGNALLNRLSARRRFPCATRVCFWLIGFAQKRGVKL